MKSLIDLTKELINKPSFDDGDLFESPAVDYLLGYMKENYPQLIVQEQEVFPKRKNIFATDGKPCKLLVINQIDTVEPSSDWMRPPFQATEENGKIYGLGSSDSKGSIAAFLTALAEVGQTNGLSILWYVDEEYNFAGMKHFASSKLSRSIIPNNILSIDGNGLALGIGCRGLLEFELTIKTTSEHSANTSKLNLFNEFSQVVEAIQTEAIASENQFLGKPTVNIARLKMGCFNKNGSFINAKNRTPDQLSAVVEIRTTPELSTESVVKAIKSVEKNDITISYKINCRYDGFSEEKMRLKTFIDLMKPSKFLDPKTFGYLDLSMLQQTYPEATICSFGAGTLGQPHTPDESVLIKDLEKAKDYYVNVINSFCK